jgi:Patatin-like phospholipase
MSGVRTRDAVGWRGWCRAVIVLSLAFLGMGCASATALTVGRAGPEVACVRAAPDRDVLVGVALSGGGTRASLFGAAGLEALARLRAPGGGSVLERADYLSSVSGGSVAASYYVTQKPSRETAVLMPDGALTADYQAFFARFKEVLEHDIESAILWRQILGFRWLNSSLAARSLHEVLVEHVLGETTFGDLSQREDRGDSPYLIVNTTLYNNGRRLIFTTLPGAAFRYDFFQALRESVARQGKPTEVLPTLVERWETLLPITSLDLGVDPCPVRVAGAVTGSASFPPLVGPITFRVGDEELYWHTGDGGLYENQGIESLLFLFLKKLQDRRARRALIIAFDSSYPFSVGSRKLGRRADPFSLFTYDFSRIPSIMEERATAYQYLFFGSLQMEGVFPDRRTARVVILRHTDAQWKEDLSDLPEACRSVKPPLRSPTEVVERIAEIPTRFWLPSECDRQLLVTAASKVVAQKQQDILELLEAPGPPRTAR